MRAMLSEELRQGQPPVVPGMIRAGIDGPDPIKRISKQYQEQGVIAVAQGPYTLTVR